MKLKTGFSEYNAAELVETAGQAGPAVANIPKFSAVLPAPATVATQRTAVMEAMLATGPGAKTALHAAMVTLAGSLSMLATNLMEVDGVTDTELAETLMPQVKERTRTTTVPNAPEDVSLKHGIVSCEVRASCKMEMENIRILDVQWTLDPVNGPWTDAEPSTKSRGITLDNLPRGKDVWIRLRGRNVVGAGPWSDPATIMVI